MVSDGIYSYYTNRWNRKAINIDEHLDALAAMYGPDFDRAAERTAIETGERPGALFADANGLGHATKAEAAAVKQCTTGDVLISYQRGAKCEDCGEAQGHRSFYTGGGPRDIMGIYSESLIELGIQPTRPPAVVRIVYTNIRRKRSRWQRFFIVVNKWLLRN